MDVLTGLLLMDTIYFHTNIFLNVFRPWTYGPMVVNVSGSMKLVHQTLERVAREGVPGHWGPRPRKLEWSAPKYLLRHCLHGRLFLDTACLVGCPWLRNWAASSPPPLSTVPGPSKFVSVLRATGDLVGGLEFEWERREKPRRGVFDLRLLRRDCASST